ncbi:MAG: phospho-N-acetylmuramoyl-pentapeptide-transferase [Clostridiaceae bacterium]|nr:phospho-N-acetylmuramoyl-pentapeptide-transferase [Clostridiaceae bacterium]
MYQLLSHYITSNQMVAVSVLFAFVAAFLCLRFPASFLPEDQGRAYAVNGAKSKGKIRGVGLILTVVFLLSTILFLPVDREYLVYCILLFAMMLSGYLDDAAKNPWSDYKKGAIDLILAILTMWNFVNYNETAIGLFGYHFVLPAAVYFVLGVVLIWVSINVTNCTDGVDGLCASVCCVTITSFAVLFSDQLENYGAANLIFVAVLLAYLCFNSKPSSMLMGDAGSRALGFYIAVIAMKSGHPFAYLLLAGVLIVDGGIGLVKIFLLRFLKISILKNTTTPLHDHVRKEKNWSDTQVVFRFSVIQIFLVLVMYLILSL